MLERLLYYIAVLQLQNYCMSNIICNTSQLLLYSHLDIHFRYYRYGTEVIFTEIFHTVGVFSTLQAIAIESIQMKFQTHYHNILPYSTQSMKENIFTCLISGRQLCSISCQMVYVQIINCPKPSQIGYILHVHSVTRMLHMSGH